MALIILFDAGQTNLTIMVWPVAGNQLGYAMQATKSKSWYSATVQLTVYSSWLGRVKREDGKVPLQGRRE